MSAYILGASLIVACFAVLIGDCIIEGIALKRPPGLVANLALFGEFVGFGLMLTGFVLSAH